MLRTDSGEVHKPHFSMYIKNLVCAVPLEFITNEAEERWSVVKVGAKHICCPRSSSV